MRAPATPSTPLRDFEATYAAGAAVNAEDDPYSRQLWRSERTIPGVDAGRDELLPFVGPPFGLPLWSQLARVNYAQAALLWSFALALAFALLTVGAIVLAARTASAFDYLAVVTLGAGFAPLTSGLALGQVAVVSCAAALLAQFALARRNALGAGFAMLAAGLQPNLAIALLARLPERRTVFAVLLATAVALGCSAIALGSPAGLIRYATLVRDHAAAESGIAIQTTVGAVASAFGAAPGTAGVLAATFALGMAAASLAIFATGRYGGLERFAIASAALPPALTFSHEHDFTLALFPAILCARRCAGWTWMAAACAGTALAANWLGFAAEPASDAQSLCLTGAAGLAFAALGPEALGTRRFVPLSIVPLAALGAALASAHPLPVWPDALPHAFHAGKTLPVAEVWRREQLATGLGGFQPVSGALRLCSLAACVTLAGAAALGLRKPRA